MDTPYHELERKEMHVRKLLTRFHDNPKLVSQAKADTSLTQTPEQDW